MLTAKVLEEIIIIIMSIVIVFFHNQNLIVQFGNSCWLKDHQKQVEAQQVEVQAFRSSVNQARFGSNSKGGNSATKRVKKSEDTTDTLKGKRELDLNVARPLAPLSAYIYETTDGRRCRVFYCSRRISTYSMVAIGKDRALLHCLCWAWNTNDIEPGADKCPRDWANTQLAA